MAMKRRTKPKWMKGLKAADIKHMKEIFSGPLTLKRFKACREWQREKGAECLECRHIALVIGLEKAGVHHERADT